MPNYSGVVINFDKKVFESLTFVLRDEEGAYLPSRSEFAINSHNKTYMVGYEGLVFATNFDKKRVLLTAVYVQKIVIIPLQLQSPIQVSLLMWFAKKLKPLL